LELELMLPLLLVHCVGLVDMFKLLLQQLQQMEHMDYGHSNMQQQLPFWVEYFAQKEWLSVQQQIQMEIHHGV
jgi:hypothetical protein